MDRHEQEGYQSLLRKQHAARMQELRRERKTERSEEHTSELQSQSNLVCRLLLEKKKKQTLLSARSTYSQTHPPSELPHSHLLQSYVLAPNRQELMHLPHALSIPPLSSAYVYRIH